MNKPCTTCGTPAIARGLCRPHYNKARSAGLLSEHAAMRVSAKDNFFNRVEKTAGCWLWSGFRNEAGYGLVEIQGRKIRAHRFCYELLVGPIQDGFILLHSCDTPACVNPDHLRPGTDADNMADCMNKGRRPSGEAHWNSRLTSSQTEFIRESKLTQQQLSKLFGISQPHVSKIKNDKLRKRG